MFDVYTVLLMFSGLLMLVVGAAISGPSTRSRAFTALIGAAFFGYGFYLEFLFTGGSYFVFYYAFVVPILFTYRAIQAHRAQRARKAAMAAAPTPVAQPGYQPQPAQPGYPPQPAQPGYHPQSAPASQPGRTP